MAYKITDKCISCGACAANCPVECIAQGDDIYEIDQDACIGCGACAAICNDVFEINDDGLSQAKVEEVAENDSQDVRDAADACPTGAIEIEQ